jgi:hypothetical protein
VLLTATEPSNESRSHYRVQITASMVHIRCSR